MLALRLSIRARLRIITDAVLSMVLADYLGLAVLIFMATATSITMLVLANRFGPKNPNKQKNMVYESGSNPIGKPQEQRFSVKFYMIALSFILFDLEAVFVIPWALAWNQNKAMGHGWHAFFVMFIFVGILTIGLVYEWKQGGLEWE